MRLNKEWRIYLSSLGALLLAAGATAFFLPDYRNLFYLFLYSAPSNSFIPVPHEPAMIFFGRLYLPELVALVAAVGTLIPCFIDYKAISFAFQAEKLRKIRDSKVYGGAVYYFLKAPFICVFLAALLPFIPFYIFRVLSPTSGYALSRYMLAVFLGRIPRYYLFALLGTLPILPLLLVVSIVLIVCALSYAVIKRHLVSRSEGSPGPVQPTHSGV